MTEVSFCVPCNPGEMILPGVVQGLVGEATEVVFRGRAYPAVVTGVEVVTVYNVDKGIVITAQADMD